MPKYPEDTIQVSIPPPGRWVWNDKSQTVEFVSSYPAEEDVLRKRRQTNVNFKELQLRAEWLAEVFNLNHRGRQSIKRSLSAAHLDAYRSSVMRRRGDLVTIEDVKQVAVSLLQENYLLPIPFCFLDILKSKELDEVLTALLLYLCCFFEHKSLENKTASLAVVDIVTEHQMMAETLAKKEMAQKKLAVCYFSLMMDLEGEQHLPYHRVLMSSSKTQWLLHACLYSFFCYVAWVTFGRKDLRDIQEELGRLLYSDAFNTAVRNRSDGDAGMYSTAVNGSVNTGAADPKETRYNSAFKQRTSQRRPVLSSITDLRSPLMVCLLPSPKERSPLLFLSSRARSQSPVRAKHSDTKALTEQLNQQLASASFGILGKPLDLYSRSTLIPCGEQKNNREKDEDDASGSDFNNSEAHPGILHVQGSKVSFMGPKSTGRARCANSPHTSSKNSSATTDLSY